MSRFTSCQASVLLAMAAMACAHPAKAGNNYPVVLVHGFLGFGPEKFAGSGFLYWGGFNDIVQHMQAGGAHQVLAASVAPIGANWDRAAELYYQIKGGCVDYGNSRARRQVRGDVARPAPAKCWAADPAHNPRHYPAAFYPAWDGAHPIHLIGHSQGGTTIRALIELLEHGSPYGDEGGGELYAGGKAGWVSSATTISAPHDGTTLREAALDFRPLVTQWTALLDQIAWMGAVPAQDAADAGGAAGPSAADFEVAQLELAPDGARDFNRWARTSPQVYYFSIATQATEAGAFCCNATDRLVAPFQLAAYQYPREDMMSFFKATAGEWIAPGRLQRGMGSYTQSAPGRVRVDSGWFANDGVVNTSSMKGPVGHPQRRYDGKSVRGTWNYLGVYPGYDHFDVLGWPWGPGSVYPVYDRIGAIIYGL